MIAARRRPAARIVVAALIALLVALLVPGWLRPEVLASDQLTYVLVGVLVVVMAAPVVVRWRARRLEFCDLVNGFNFSYLLHFGLGAVFAAGFGSRFLNANAGNADFEYINLSVAFAVLGILSMSIAYYGRAGAAFTRLFKNVRGAWNPRLVIPVSLAALAVGYAVRVMIMISLAGSIGDFLNGDKDQLIGNADGLTYASSVSGLATIALMAFLVDGRLRKSRASMALFWAALPLEVAFRFLSGSRSSLAFLLLSLAVAFYLSGERNPRTNRRYAGVCGVALLFAVVLFPLTTSVRFLGNATDPLEIFAASPQLLTGEGMAYFVGERFHGVESLALLIKTVPRERPYNYGRSMTDILIAWIPRQVWPDKPTVSLARNFQADVVPDGLFPPTAAVAVTLPGEYYWSFGLPGLLCGMFMVGCALRALQNRLVRPKANATAILLVGTMFPTIIQSVEQDTGYLFTYGLVNYLIALAFCAVLSRGAEA